MKPITNLLLICAMLAVAGCATGNARLESGGAYAAQGTSAAPGHAFYVADAAFKLAHSAMDAAFRFERENRAALVAISPQIKPALDQIREPAWQVVVQYARARQAYLAQPNPAGLSRLQTLLAELQRLSAAATAALPKA